MSSITSILDIFIIISMILLSYLVKIRTSLWIRIVIIIIVLLVDYILYINGTTKIFPKIFDIGLLILVVFLIIIEYTIPIKMRPKYERYHSTITYFGISLVVLISLLIKKPITIDDDKDKICEYEWDNKFYNKNVYMTSAWVIVYIMMGISSLIPSMIKLKNKKYLVFFKTIIPLILLLLGKNL